MADLTTILTALMSSAVACAALTPVFKRLAPAVGAVARPSGERWHRRSVPLLGGGAIYLATVIGVFATYAVDTRVGWIVAGASVMMFVGALDDFLHLKPGTKLVAQLLVACVLLVGGLQRAWTGVGVVDALLSIFWFVAITNAFNLLDNMDGLCAGVAAIAAAAFALSTLESAPSLALVGLALVGASAAFLLFNFHPASIFMGDTGSLFIGSMLAGLSLSVAPRETVGVLSALAFPILLLLIPIFDTAFVTVLRKLSSRKASMGGRDHTSHRLVAMGFRESQAVLLLYAFATLGGVTALAVSRWSMQEATLLTGVLLVALALLGVRLARVNVYGSEELALLRDKPYTPLLTDFAYKRRVFEVMLDIVLASLAYYGAYAIRFGEQFGALYADLFLGSLPIVLACEIAGLYLGGAYRGIWRYFAMGDLVTYLKGLSFGTVGALLAIVLLYRFEGYSRSVFIINALVFAALVVSSRLSFRALAELASLPRDRGEPAFIYGAGEGGILLARELRHSRRFNYRAIGFIDDDPSKQGRRVLGVPVRGALSDLEALLGKHRPTVVMLSTHIHPERLEQLNRICFMSGTRLLQLHFQLTDLGQSIDVR